MEIWVDAQLPPAIASFVNKELKSKCVHVLDFGFHAVSDNEILRKAKETADVIIITKDEVFAFLLEQKSSPPKIIWLTIGNCSNATLKDILKRNLPSALELLKTNDLVEISN